MNINNLESIYRNEFVNYNQCQVENLSIDIKLPFAVFELILSYLNDREMQSAVRVNRYWKCVIIDITKRKEFSLIRNFADFLIQNIDKKLYPTQIETFPDVSRSHYIFDSLTLIEVKLSLVKLREEYINSLKDLTNEELNTLQSLCTNKIKPQYFENIFDLTKIYKRIDKVNMLPNEMQKVNALLDIVKALTQSGDIDQAIKVAKAIAKEWQKGEALWEISKKLTRSGKINQAIKVAKIIPEGIQKANAFMEASQALTQSGDIDQAIKVAKAISDQWQKGKALWEISQALIQSDKIDQAIKIARTIPDELQKIGALEEIFQALKQSDIDQTIEVSPTVPNKKLICKCQIL